MKIRYMTIRQKEETFLLTKFKASELLNHVSFHFRQPYSEDDGVEDVSMKKYIDELEKKGLEIDPSSTGIQRRLLISKIDRIKKYLKFDEESFFPNAVILSTDLSREDKFNSFGVKDDFGDLDLPDSVKFTIVDGQHRLAGLFLSGKEIQDDFEIPAILLINITADTCAKIFSDVNGTQSTVNKSVILDLYEMSSEADFDDSKRIEECNLHTICKKFNTDPESPLYRHIKMLGIGEGAISQAFFVNAIARAVRSVGIDYFDIQYLYDNFFFYFRAFQRTFSNQWPVLENFADYDTFRTHSQKVMKIEKSQILKTNGFGGIIKAFPRIYLWLKQNGDLTYLAYQKLISNLYGKIDWCKDSTMTQGTGAKNQENVSNLILGHLGLLTKQENT